MWRRSATSSSPTTSSRRSTGTRPTPRGSTCGSRRLPGEPVDEAKAFDEAMEQPRFDLTGQVALVTGANKGIGRDLAIALAGAGARVAAAVRDPASADPVVAEIRVAGGEAEAIEMELRSREST